jgi:hypothetical protein
MLVAGQGCASRPEQAEVRAGLGSSPTWVRTELFFGLGVHGTSSGLTEEQWMNWLDEEVTSRFPDGFTQFEAYGQWRPQDRPGLPVTRLRSRTIVILHPDSREADQLVEEVRTSFLRRFDQDSVLRSSQPARVSF